MTKTRLAIICLGILLVRGYVSAAEPEDYLTKSGELKKRLILRDSGGFTGAGTGQSWVIETSGAWARAAADKGKNSLTAGKLTQKQLADLVRELARHDLLQLPRECNKLSVADGINVVIEFGEQRFLFHGKHGLSDLPPADVTTHAGRFAGAARAIQEATRD